MKTLIVLTLAMVGVVGCHSSNNGGNNVGDNDNNDDGGIIVVDNQLRDLASQTADSEPSTLGDATALQNDINTLFSGADADPVDVETGDSIEDVINRAGGS